MNQGSAHLVRHDYAHPTGDEAIFRSFSHHRARELPKTLSNGSRPLKIDLIATGDNVTDEAFTVEEFCLWVSYFLTVRKYPEIMQKRIQKVMQI